MSLEKDLSTFELEAKKKWLWYYNLKEWEEIYRLYKKPNWEIEKIVKGVLEEIIITFNWNDRLFNKRVKVKWYEEEFSIKKFKRFYNISKK
jgi:hypothetical protein